MKKKKKFAYSTNFIAGKQKKRKNEKQCRLLPAESRGSKYAQKLLACIIIIQNENNHFFFFKFYSDDSKEKQRKKQENLPHINRHDSYMLRDFRHAILADDIVFTISADHTLPLSNQLSVCLSFLDSFPSSPYCSFWFFFSISLFSFLLYEMNNINADPFCFFIALRLFVPIIYFLRFLHSVCVSAERV